MAQQPAAKPKRPRKPLGKAIVHTDEELDQLATVTPADIEAASALWKASAPPALANLLDAKQKESDAE